MATINFLYRSTRSNANLVLRLLYSHNEKNFVFGANTNLNVSQKYWSKYHKMERPKDIVIKNQQTEINNELNKIENHILNRLRNVDKDLINKEWLQKELDHYYNPQKKVETLTNELVKYIDVYIDYKRNEIKQSTIAKFNGIKQLLIRYQIDQNVTILISDVNMKFKFDFETYCIKNNYAPNTIARAVIFIKTFCKHARFNGIETHYQLEGIKGKRQKVESIYLTFAELEQIENAILTDSLDNARDLLIISAYTAQRVSDFMRFTKDMIRYEKNKKDGKLKPLIEFTQKKTGKLMTVPLHKKVLEILNKRNGEFPYSISDQKYNDYIKEVCKIAGLTENVRGSKSIETEIGSKIYRKQAGIFQKWELVTSHIGRRSFVSNYYGEIPTSYLIYISGHSSEENLRIYLGKSNADMAMQMTDFF